MGVRGLIDVILEEQDVCVDVVDLVLVAQERGGIEILVDFHSFKFFIMDAFQKSISKHYNNDYLCVTGGEYKALDAYLEQFIRILRDLQISLVMLEDGGKGSSMLENREKQSTWEYRHSMRMKQIPAIFDAIRGSTRIQDIDGGVLVMCQPWRGDQITSTLLRCQCELLTIASGDADKAIALALKERPKAYAILSNDSDLFMYPGSRTILPKLFDLENMLGLGKPQNLPSEPKSLRCGVITSSKVASFLGV